jgi:hypothetical protein
VREGDQPNRFIFDRFGVFGILYLLGSLVMALGRGAVATFERWMMRP